MKEFIIPIIIVCHNNYKYVQNTIQQIENINKDYANNILVLNANSDCLDTVNYLNKLPTHSVYHSTVNNGPFIDRYLELYNKLPNKFILSDPDLEYNKNLPYNFIDILEELSDKYNTFKIGFSLDISDYDKMFNYTYCKGLTINDWEMQFWEYKIEDNNYELYNAEIDTTFCLINKQNKYSYRCLRIAGNFTCKHIPWYIKNNIYNTYSNYMLYNNKPISTTGIVFSQYISDKFFKVNKNNELFFINNNDVNINFWKNHYSCWENETFEIFDRYLDKNKIFIDIGAWIGTTTMYGSRNSKFVYSIDADKLSFKDLIYNCEQNCENNYKLYNNAIYNKDNIDIKFGKNLFLVNSKLNDSTSQIYSEKDNDNDLNDAYYIKTITLKTILDENNIKPGDISLIKVDIEGGEEFILNELIEINKIYNSKLYVSFHYSWWKDKNLDRFDFLSKNQKLQIEEDPFISILF